MKLQPTYFKDFSGGVLLNLPSKKLTKNISPRAVNSMLRPIRGGGLVVSPRPGYKVVKTLAAPPPPTSRDILASAFYNVIWQGALQTYHLILCEDNTVWYSLVTDSSWGNYSQKMVSSLDNEFPDGIFAEHTSDFLVNFVQPDIGYPLLGFVRDGASFKFYKDASGAMNLHPIGSMAPVVPVSFGETAGGAGHFAAGEVLEVRLTYYNSDTGVESAPSPILTHTMVANNAGWYITISDANLQSQHTHLNVYLRVPRLRTEFVRLDSMRYSDWSGGILIDYTDDEVNDMIILCPEEWENGLPPTAPMAACWHLQRLFVTDGLHIYYSEPGGPEQFSGLAVENVSGGSGDLIMGLLSMADHSLGVFKERSIHEIAGTEPQNWDENELVPNRGTISSRSIAKGDGLIAFWSAEGPCVWDRQSEPRVLTREISNKVSSIGTSSIYYDKVFTVFDSDGHRFLFCDPDVSIALVEGDTEFRRIYPWSTVFQAFEASYWSTSFSLDIPTNKPSQLVVGPIYRGLNRIVMTTGLNVLITGLDYKMDGAGDTAESEKGAGNIGVVTAAAAIDEVTFSLAIPGATLRAASAAIPYVTCVNLTTLEVRRSTYTLTGSGPTWTLTLQSPPSTQLPVGSLLLFNVPVLEWDTVDEDHDSPSYEKRALNMYLETVSGGDLPCALGLFRNNELTPIRVWNPTLAANDRNIRPWSPVLSGAVRTFKRWAGVRYQWMRARFIGWQTRCTWGLSMIGWQAVVHDDEDE